LFSPFWPRVTLAAVISVVALGQRHLSLNRPPAQTRRLPGAWPNPRIDPIAKTVRISHEEISNYMPAMTMSLPVKDPALFRNLQAGDEVQFELLVTDAIHGSVHIDRIQSEPPTIQAEDKSTQSPEELETLSFARRDGPRLYAYQPGWP
jgi:Cu/Ag efflux protein CusF